MSTSIECQCELHIQSIYSPSVIDNNENIAIAVVQPMHINDNGELQDSFIKWQDLKDRDASVFRSSIATNKEITDNVINGLLKKDKPDRALEGFYNTNIQNLKSINIDDGINPKDKIFIQKGKTIRAVCIFDSGLENYPSHASIGCPEIFINYKEDNSISHKEYKKIIKAVRERIVRVFTKCDVQQLDDILTEINTTY